MPNELAKYLFEKQEVRVWIGNNNQPWFVADDVAVILGYRMASDMTRNLDDDELHTHFVRTGAGMRKMTIINESGVYSAIFSSNKPEAKQFKRWVTHEVLPAIREKGYFIDDNQALTARSTQQIYATLFQELRRALPNANITATCNLIVPKSKTREQRNREVSDYRFEMDNRNVPGITVVDGKPIQIIFDWHNYRLWPKETFKALYAKLGALCADYKSLLVPSRPPFGGGEGSLAEIGGFKTVAEAQALAEKLRAAVAESLPALGKAAA